MKGVLLAGGRGSRLRPFSHATPKHLVPVANTPVVEYGLAALRNAGVTEIGIVVGPSSAAEIEAHVGDGTEFGVDVTYVHQDRPLGLAHAVDCAREFVGADPFVVYFGDTIVGERLTESLVDAFDPRRDATGLLVQAVEEPSRFGVVELEDGDVVGLHEKPVAAPTNLAYVGVLAFTPIVFEYIDDLEPSDRGELELTDAIDRMARAEETITHRVVEGLWKDVGTPTDVVETNRLVVEDCERHIDGDVAAGATVIGAVRLEEGATVEAGAAVRGPAIVGENSVVERGATVGPYASVGTDCVVAGATVEESVVCDGASIRCDERIVESLVGRNATLVTDGHDERGRRYVVGDDAQIRR